MYTILEKSGRTAKILEPFQTKLSENLQPNFYENGKAMVTTGYNSYYNIPILKA